jgi:hypothetical protein
VSLSQDPAFTQLKNDFVCGTKDITGAPWSGFSGIHPIDGGAVHTTNGAGPHNIQMFVLAQDGTVLTCLPGYWHPEDLAHELELATELNKVWTDRKLTREQKNAKFTEMHLQHIAEHPRTMTKRSQMQGFDKKFEEKQRLAETDTVYAMTGGRNDGPIFKTTDVIFHERLAKQPFKPYASFDVVAFSDYGRAKYDKKEEGGQPAVDTRPQTIEKRKRMMEMRAAAKRDRLGKRGRGAYLPRERGRLAA